MKQLWQPIWITVAKKILSEKYAAAAAGGGGGGADLVSCMGDADSHDGQLGSAAVPILRCSRLSLLPLILLLRCSPSLLHAFCRQQRNLGSNKMRVMMEILQKVSN